MKIKRGAKILVFGSLCLFLLITVDSTATTREARESFTEEEIQQLIEQLGNRDEDIQE